MDPSRHVLHVIPSISRTHGGPSRAMRLMELALATSTWRCLTATTDDDGHRGSKPRSLDQSLSDGGGSRLYFRKSTDFYKVAWTFAPWVTRAVRDFDVVHIHSLFSFTSVVAAWAARRAGVPYILRPLGTLAIYGRTQRRPWLKRLSLSWIEGPLLRDAAAVHFTSVEEQREAALCGIPMRGVVLPLGLETPDCTAATANATLVRRRFTELGDAPYILFLSRLDPKKNIEGLLNAFSKCRVQLPHVKLLIAGTGTANYVAACVALARDVGVNDHVIWAGHIEGEIKQSALAGAMMFVLPSFSENFGIAAAEALMAGLPCVLGRGVAISADVASAGAGIVVAPDADAIAAGLVQLTEDEPRRQRMSVNAVTLAISKFSVEAMGRNLVALYEDVAQPKI